MLKYFSKTKGEQVGLWTRIKRGFKRVCFHRKMIKVNKTPSTSPRSRISPDSDPESIYKAVFDDIGRDFSGTAYAEDYVCPRINSKGSPIFDDEYLIKTAEEYKVDPKVESCTTEVKDAPTKKNNNK